MSLVWNPNVVERFLEIGTKIENKQRAQRGFSLSSFNSPHTREAGLRLLGFPLRFTFRAGPNLKLSPPWKNTVDSPKTNSLWYLSFGKPNLRYIDTTNQIQPRPNFEDQRLCQALNDCRVETSCGHDACTLQISWSWYHEVRQVHGYRLLDLGMT